MFKYQFILLSVFNLTFALKQEEFNFAETCKNKNNYNTDNFETF